MKTVRFNRLYTDYCTSGDCVKAAMKSSSISIQMGCTALGVPVNTNLFMLMGVSLLGYGLDHPRFDSWQGPDSFLFSKMPTQPPFSGTGGFYHE